MSESRYLLFFTALLAGALVVCAPMVLFRTAAEHDTSWLDAEPQIAPYAVAGKGWEAVVTAEPVARDEMADLPPAVPLAQVDTYVADLPEVRPVLAMLSAEETTNADEPSPEPVKVAQLEEEILDESSGASVTYASEPEPQHMAEEPMSEPVQVAELDEASPAPAPQHEAQKPAPEAVRVSEPDAPMSGDDSASSATPAAEPSPDIAPPLPSRRPAPIRTAEIVVAQENAAPRQSGRVERSNDEVPPLRWRPMALAPADTPTPPKLSPPAQKLPSSGGLSAAAHRSKVWSALARHKPRAGQRGSATVTFAIGASGGLRGARIAKSSGNAKIDQMALATVRNAAPFPAPPNLKSGAASYTIRIEFR
ncbi:MAG TPA: TonB family protein [Methyloceanibacter sp.]|nr:TonB family protein [Methyloceanibacter sp.]